MNQKFINAKICLLGMFGVGKTSLVHRFVYNRFDESYLSTIGVTVSQKILPPIQSESGIFQQLKFLIWDIEGTDDNVSSRNNYYIGSAGAMIVADLNRHETIKRIPRIIDAFKKNAPEAKLVLIGNKVDLMDDVSTTKSFADLQKYASNLSSPLLLSSAKSGENVENSFLQLAELLLK